MKQRVATRRPVPPQLSARLAGAVEVAPHAEFRIRNAGQRLAQLFGDELQRRLAARAADKAKGATA